jgi:5-methylcytosine-specific restriction endonuclease McrA
LKQSDCYQKKREQYKLKARQYRKVLRVKNMKLLWNFLSDHPCKCGETNPVVLELDHLRNKKYNISDVIYCHTWLSIQKELKKCQVLCANCHRKKTAKQLGYYSYMDNIEALLN